MTPKTRVVGRRQEPPAGQIPSPEARAKMAEMASYTTRAPKGVFHYRSHEEANRAREEWLLQAMTEKAR